MGRPACSVIRIVCEAAVGNIGEARQEVRRHVARPHDALVIGGRVHETEIHQTGIDLSDAPVVAAGAPAAVTEIDRVFHGRDPAVRLRRRALQDLQLSGRHRLVLRFLGTLVPAVKVGERLLFEVRQEKRECPVPTLDERPPWGIVAGAWAQPGGNTP